MLIYSFKLWDNGNFFINLVIQQIGLSYFVQCTRWRDLFLIGNGTPHSAKTNRDESATDAKWIQDEKTLLPIGQTYALFCTLITMVC